MLLTIFLFQASYHLAVLFPSMGWIEMPKLTVLVGPDVGCSLLNAFVMRNAIVLVQHMIALYSQGLSFMFVR